VPFRHSGELEITGPQRAGETLILIEDMTVRNLSPATQQSYLNAISRYRSSVGILVAPLIVLAWKMSTRFRFIWLQRGSHGLR
jgi:hypothetical protein